MTSKSVKEKKVEAVKDERKNIQWMEDEENIPDVEDMCSLEAQHYWYSFLVLLKDEVEPLPWSIEFRHSRKAEEKAVPGWSCVVSDLYMDDNLGLSRALHIEQS